MEEKQTINAAMNNISHIKDCYGCGVCSTICPRNIISIKLNSDGFYAPTIELMDKCTDCGLCLDVCAYSDSDVETNDEKYTLKGFGGWSLDNKIHSKCSSGGIGFEIGRYLIENGYKACGVRYNRELDRAEHYMAQTVEEFIPSIGSKYIPSYTCDGFKEINRKDRFFITGTPCQIDSMRRYIKRLKCENNFVLLDFFCHGVPSMNLWDKYLKFSQAESKGAGVISWRDKKHGWHDSWVVSMYDKHKTSLLEDDTPIFYSRLSKNDLFYKLFLGNACLGKACYDHCKYKLANSSADIRIGDFWGKTYSNNNDGVSSVVVFTEKGESLISELNRNCVFIAHPVEIVAEGQMSKSPRPGKILYNHLNKLLKSKKTLPQIVSSAVWVDRFVHFPQKIIKTLKK
ncbi:Coenzyme F420 hydrogenase/dehydrogenase, beta subunit C-terminal domain [Dysgonomonas sp. ZJ279]|uniref:Coenzyme F420 hydrogenase/dehydrogenase, beta subunit C-terminal domain n=1 Tax=Dysgonomonas sp. ZJ279 TaxID=2709796 RepID=UPI002103011D|nr:Coenzyme F420 hydrogenase/dehydrogenase, beta subunit C-terminal domain [Dysgonomonas sp. ZJ279]